MGFKWGICENLSNLREINRVNYLLEESISYFYENIFFES